MKILGIDTSGLPCGAALLEDGKILEEMTLPQELTPSKHFLSLIDELLRKYSLAVEEIDGMAATIGPGSFTSLRIGISTVKGLAWTHNIPVAGIGALDALARKTTPSPYLICPILDARQGEVYASIYRWEGNSLVKKDKDLLISPRHLAVKLKGKTLFLGSGIHKHAEEFKTLLNESAVFEENIDQPGASIIALMGYEIIKQGKGISPTELTPYYLRPPAAKVKAGIIL